MTTADGPQPRPESADAAHPVRPETGTLVPRTPAGRVIALLVLLKAAVLIFNAATYPAIRQYDAEHHAWRARSGGLEMGKMAYNSPLYYLPALPWADLSRFYDGGSPRLGVPHPPEEVRANLRLLEGFQWLNVLYVLGMYLVWVCGILPRLAPSRDAWFAGALALLALPGFQKAAVMAHPDVLLLFLASLTFFLTVHWLERPPRFARSLALAVLAGLTGACRPFAVVPMLLSWALNVGSLVRGAFAEVRAGAVRRSAAAARLGLRVAAVSLIAAALSAGWWAFRREHTGAVLNAYNDPYMARFKPLRQGFDFGHYYATFYLGKLLEVPSRADEGVDPSRRRGKNNSFWTLLYSETWGDHHLYFSGTKNHERKLWVKRVLFVAALPLSALLAAGVVTGTVQAVAEAWRRRLVTHPPLLAAAMFWGGFALFVLWQATAGLLPGKNSTVKFLYIAWIVPFGIGTAASQGIGPRLFRVLVVCAAAAALAAFPMSLNLD